MAPLRVVETTLNAYDLEDGSYPLVLQERLVDDIWRMAIVDETSEV